MFAVLNITIIALIALIAYWWGSQGLFSAILHLLCVVTAATIALAFWEPIVIGLLLRGGGFDNYAWGLTLALLFAISLLLLRVVIDRTIGANVKIPSWANLVFGGGVGAVAGVITMGMFVISAGFMQSVKDPFGYSPAHRGSRGTIELGRPLWVPVDRITSDLFSLLSVTSLSTQTPLKQINPKLWQQGSLLRDSIGGGKGQFAVKPSNISIGLTYFVETEGIYSVQVDFKTGARDFGSVLSLSNAQVRLIGQVTGQGAPQTLHPVSWTQGSGHYTFDDITHYISSESGAQTTQAMIDFKASHEFKPRYIQIRNIRYPIRVEDDGWIPIERLRSMWGVSGDGSGAGASRAVQLGGRIDSVLTINDQPRPIRASTNQALGTLELVDERFERGAHTFIGGGPRPSRTLAIKGLYEPPGTRMIQLDVSRGTAATVYGDHLRDLITENDEIFMVDSNNRNYWPVGYVHLTGSGDTLLLDPVSFIRTMDQLPVLPSSGTQELRLLFLVPDNVTMRRFKVGAVTIGTCSLVVTPDAR